MVRPSTKRLRLLLTILSICASLLVLARLRDYFLTRSSTEHIPSKAEELLKELWACSAHEEDLDKTLWSKERLAERYGAVFEALWDGLNKASNKLDLLASF